MYLRIRPTDVRGCDLHSQYHNAKSVSRNEITNKVADVSHHSKWQVLSLHVPHNFARQEIDMG